MNRSIALAAVISLVGGTFLAASPRVANAQTPPGQIVFDALTGIDIGGPSNDLQSPGNNPVGRTFLGQPFIPVSTPLPQVNITGIDFYYASAVPANYTNVLVNIQFYNFSTNDATNTGTTPVFSSPSASLQSISLGSQVFLSGGARFQSLTFATPITLQNLGSNPGFAINIQGDTGSGLTSSSNLYTAVRGGFGADGSQGPAIAVGSIPFDDPEEGYYRNVSGRTDFNFVGNDGVRNRVGAPNGTAVGANSALAVRLYAAVPEPGTFGLVAVGLLGFAPILRRRK